MKVESGFRLLSYGQGVKPGETDFMCSFWDMLPTFAQMTGCKVKSGTDGISLMPLLTGKRKQRQRNKKSQELKRGYLAIPSFFLSITGLFNGISAA